MNIAVISNEKTDIKFEGCSIAYFSPNEKAGPEIWGGYDAAFLVGSFSEKVLINWVGHPYLRQLDDICELKAEIEFIKRGVEIEKKLLIKYPDFESLKKYFPFKADIVQVYLLSDDGSHRIRKRTMGNAVSYVETIKKRIDGASSYEQEKRIDETEYNRLLSLADKSKHPIIKQRYCFLFEGQYFELDTYDFWNDRATLELELKDENEAFTLPPEITVIADVTYDFRYKNNYLAGIKYEDYKTELL